MAGRGSLTVAAAAALVWTVAEAAVTRVGGGKVSGVDVHTAGTDTSFSLGITGDVNLNPNLAAGTDPAFVWGDTLRFTRAVSVMAIQHESTLAEVSPRANGGHEPAMNVSDPTFI